MLLCPCVRAAKHCGCTCAKLLRADLKAQTWIYPGRAFLQGDVCRRELGIEIEGVFAAA